MQALIEWMGTHFSPEQYAFWAPTQCMAWTLADFVIVYYLLRIANLARDVMGVRPHRVSYAVLACTVPPALFIPFATTGGGLFALELAVTVPHFLAIVYVLIADTRRGGPSAIASAAYRRAQDRARERSDGTPAQTRDAALRRAGVSQSATSGVSRPPPR